MDKMDWLQALTEENQIEAVMETNQRSERFGLRLTQKDAKLLVQERQNVLKEQKRVEFGKSILPKIIDTFCDSQYIGQDNYVDTLLKLQEIFFLFKNESMDCLSDDELLYFMKEQFETICYGDTEYLEGTCLPVFAQAVRSGYRGYQARDSYGEYFELDEVTRWDKELYLEALRELCWR